MKSVGKIILALLLLLMLSKCNTDEETIADPVIDTTPCNIEKMQLLGQMINDHDKLFELKSRLQEMDPSPDMIIATEMMSWEKLEKFYEKEKLKCQSR